MSWQKSVWKPILPKEGFFIGSRCFNDSGGECSKMSVQNL